LQVGDVVVKAADDLLPNKENPSLDLLARLERAYTAGKSRVDLGYLRGGVLATAALELDPATLPPLDPGSLGRQARYARVAGPAPQFLAGLQRENGSFPAATSRPETDVAVSALAGLALLAGKPLADASAREPALEKCRAFVAGAAASPPASPPCLALAVLFL